jgi:signal transduction histidine kinase
MKSPRLILLLGFGTLLILIGLLALSAFWRAERIYSEVSSIHESYRKSASILDDIYTDVYRAAVLIRDFLIDPQIAAGGQYRNDLLSVRSSMENRLVELGPFTEDKNALDRLRHEIDAYWDSTEPVFDWTPQQKAELGFRFLRQQVLPRREAVILMTREINSLNADSLANVTQKMNQNQDTFRRQLGGMSGAVLLLGLLIASVSFFYISRLERRSEEERRRIEHAEQEMRLLSQKLVRAQEEERRSISRELHDEIGQMLTGLRLELRNLEEFHMAPGADFQKNLAEIKDLAEKTMRAVRDLAMGLRPSMLDDLGLGPALQWQAREYSRHNGIPATVDIDGDLDNLSEDVLTCVYRVVQESLTNCARHAQAKNVRITVHGSKSGIAVTIQDDGVGFDSGSAISRGIGLIGMKERVRELGGTVALMSQPNKGTIVELALPLGRKQAL